MVGGEVGPVPFVLFVCLFSCFTRYLYFYIYVCVGFKVGRGSYR